MLICLSRNLLPVIQDLHAQFASPPMEATPPAITAPCPRPHILRNHRLAPLAGTPAPRPTRPLHNTARGRDRAPPPCPPLHGAAAPAAPRGPRGDHLSHLTSPRTKLSLHQSPTPPQQPECPESFHITLLRNFNTSQQEAVQNVLSMYI